MHAPEPCYFLSRERADMDLIKFHYFSNYYLSRRKFSSVPCVGTCIYCSLAYDWCIRTLCFLVIVIVSFGKPCNENAEYTENNVKTKPYRFSPLMAENLPRPMSSHFLLSSLLLFRLKFLYIFCQMKIYRICQYPLPPFIRAKWLWIYWKMKRMAVATEIFMWTPIRNKPKTTSSRIVVETSSPLEYRTISSFKAWFNNSAIKNEWMCSSGNFVYLVYSVEYAPGWEPWNGELRLKWGMSCQRGFPSSAELFIKIMVNDEIYSTENFSNDKTEQNEYEKNDCNNVMLGRRLDPNENVIIRKGDSIYLYKGLLEHSWRGSVDDAQI